MNEVIKELTKVVNAIMGGDAMLQTVINKEYNPKTISQLGDGVEWKKTLKRDMVLALANYLIDKNLLFTEETKMPNGNSQYRMTLFSINPRYEKE